MSDEPEPAVPLPDAENPAPAVPREPDEDSLRLAEAMIFASAEPVSARSLTRVLPDDIDADAVLGLLRARYAGRGVELVDAGNGYMFRTALDLAPKLRKVIDVPRRLPRVSLETLAIIAYHQPVTRADIEEIRGVAVSKGAIDVLMEAGWVRMRGRRKAPGRPITYGTTAGFLIHFGLDAVGDLPGLDELQGAGLFDGKLPPGFGVPQPDDGDTLRPDEEPLGEPGALEQAWGPVGETDAD